MYIGPGTKKWNEVRIADGCTIGADACVLKAVRQRGMPVGQPGRKVVYE